MKTSSAVIACVTCSVVAFLIGGVAGFSKGKAVGAGDMAGLYANEVVWSSMLQSRLVQASIEGLPQRDRQFAYDNAEFLDRDFVRDRDRVMFLSKLHTPTGMYLNETDRKALEAYRAKTGYKTPFNKPN